MISRTKSSLASCAAAGQLAALDQLGPRQRAVIVLSDGKSVLVPTVDIGHETVFAFWLGRGVTPVSWTAFGADHGNVLGHGKA